MENKKNDLNDLLDFFKEILEESIKEDKKEPQKVDVEKLAYDHWSYISGLLHAHGEEEYVIQKIGYHYVTAFIHGYKHAVEEIENK